MMKFYIDSDKIIKHEYKNLYIHMDRFNELLKKKNNRNIPKKIHFVFFSKGKPFNFIYYIAIKSALYHNPTYQVYLHTDAMPDFNNNIYLQHLKDNIIINLIEEPKRLNDHNIYHFQHKADYVRLNVLEKFGGIYLDLDFISLKSFDHFLNYIFVMSYENDDS